MEERRGLAGEFAGYVTEALRVRREVGVVASDDLTTGLIGSMVAGAPLSHADIVSLLRNWTAGHGTVVAALGILVYHLAAHADVQQLRREPMLLPAAIEEMLRADGPLVTNRRTTTRDVAIGGRKIGAGEKLSLVWITANRDERTFADPARYASTVTPGTTCYSERGFTTAWVPPGAPRDASRPGRTAGTHDHDRTRHHGATEERRLSGQWLPVAAGAPPLTITLVLPCTSASLFAAAKNR